MMLMMKQAPWYYNTERGHNKHTSHNLPTLAPFPLPQGAPLSPPQRARPVSLSATHPTKPPTLVEQSDGRTALQHTSLIKHGCP